MSYIILKNNIIAGQHYVQRIQFKLVVNKLKKKKIVKHKILCSSYKYVNNSDICW